MPRNYVTYLVMALVLVFMIRRNMRSRQIRVETMWILPIILVAIAGVTVAQSPPHDLALIGALVLAFAAGGIIGWYRGRFTEITLDPATGVLMGRGSVIGLLLVLALYVARYAMMGWARSHPIAGEGAIAAGDGILLFGYATLIVARLEMFIRCRKLMAEYATA